MYTQSVISRCVHICVMVSAPAVDILKRLRPHQLITCFMDPAVSFCTCQEKKCKLVGVVLLWAVHMHCALFIGINWNS